MSQIHHIMLQTNYEQNPPDCLEEQVQSMIAKLTSDSHHKIRI